MPLDPADRRELARFGRELAAVTRQVRRLRTSQGRFRSVDGGSTVVYDDDGNVRQVQGQQEDGTYTVVDLNGAPPNPVNPPGLDGRPGLLVVSSYGQPIGPPDEWPLDFARIDVHVGTSSAFTRTTATKVGEFGRDGGTIAVALDPGNYWAALVAVNTSGVESEIVIYSGPATVTSPATGAGGVATYRSDTEPVGLDAADDGSLWYDTNDDDRAHRWDGTALVWVPLIVGGSALAADALYGKVVEGAVIRTAASGLRWVLSSPSNVNTLDAHSGLSTERTAGGVTAYAYTAPDGAQVIVAAPLIGPPGTINDTDHPPAQVVLTTNYDPADTPASSSLAQVQAQRVALEADVVDVVGGLLTAYDGAKVLGDLEVTGATSVAGTIARTGETWHDIGPLLVNSYSERSGWPCQYRKDAAGAVWMQGLLDSAASTASTAFVLPVGYRPSAQLMFGVYNASGTVSRVTIGTDGTVAFLGATAHTWVSISELAFTTL